jgi:hypothetical protein
LTSRMGGKTEVSVAPSAAADLSDERLGGGEARAIVAELGEDLRGVDRIDRAARVVRGGATVDRCGASALASRRWCFTLAVRRGVRAHHWLFGDMPTHHAVTDRELADIVWYVHEVQKADGIE